MSKVDKTQLIQTAVCSIIYGQFSGECQELFRCPRELDDVTLEGMSMTTDACLALKTMIQKTAALMAESVLAISGYISGMAGMEDGLLIKDAMCRKRTYAVLQTLSMNLTGDSREAAAGQ